MGRARGCAQSNRNLSAFRPCESSQFGRLDRRNVQRAERRVFVGSWTTVGGQHPRCVNGRTIVFGDIGQYLPALRRADSGQSRQLVCKSQLAKATLESRSERRSVL